jgi:hypothetical protein
MHIELQVLRPLQQSLGVLAGTCRPECSRVGTARVRVLPSPGEAASLNIETVEGKIKERICKEAVLA